MAASMFLPRVLGVFTSDSASAETWRLSAWVVMTTLFAGIAVATGWLDEWKLPFMMALAMAGCRGGEYFAGPVTNWDSFVKVSLYTLSIIVIVAIPVVLWMP